MANHFFDTSAAVKHCRTPPWLFSKAAGKRKIYWKGGPLMNVVRVHRKLDSETLHLPEIKPLLGKMVEISVQELAPEVRDEFWAEAARLPEDLGAFEAQKATFRAWRADQRFEPYWSVLDELLARPFEQVRKWAAAAEAAGELKDYDFDAWRQQREYDLQHAHDHLP